MSDATIIAVEGDIVTRIQAASQTAGYLGSGTGGTVRGVADAKTAMDLTAMPPPAVVVEFAGESAGSPLTIGSPARQVSRLLWDLFCLAQSFGSSGEGRLDDVDTGEPGAYTMLDDVFAALEGYLLPSQPAVSKLFYRGSRRFALRDARVVYVSQWYCDVTRTGNN